MITLKWKIFRVANIIQFIYAVKPLSYSPIFLKYVVCTFIGASYSGWSDRRIWQTEGTRQRSWYFLCFLPLDLHSFHAGKNECGYEALISSINGQYDKYNR